MLSLLSLQEYIRFEARQDHEVVSSPPFTLFFHPTNARSWANYALPDASGNNPVQDGLRRLQTLFPEHDRTPCLRFIEEVFPHLPPMLRSSGWFEVERPQVMICTPETFQSAPGVLGLSITSFSQQSSVEEICEGLDTTALGFNPQAERATPQEAEAFRQNRLFSRTYTARLQEQPVGAGRFTEIHQGWTELGGITTLSPFRRRGIAAALTAFLTQEAFRQGATHAFLLAGKQASRVYERVGFLPSATLMVYERLCAKA
jgi:GNAT superfamily N-acetyltransferase